MLTYLIIPNNKILKNRKKELTSKLAENRIVQFLFNLHFIIIKIRLGNEILNLNTILFNKTI